MSTHPTAWPLVFVGGDPSLDLVNTVSWTRQGPIHERLTSYDSLTRWAEGAGILNPHVAEQLRRSAQRHAKDAAAVLEKAQETRAILRELFSPSRRTGILVTALDTYNHSLREVLQHVEIQMPARRGGTGAQSLRWSWRDLEDSLECPLWLVLWSAAKLLVSDEVAKIRTCAGANCGWLYVDRSRNGLRRWCRMQTCGTKSKSRHRRLRRARALK